MAPSPAAVRRAPPLSFMSFIIVPHMLRDMPSVFFLGGGPRPDNWAARCLRGETLPEEDTRPLCCACPAEKVRVNPLVFHFFLTFIFFVFLT